jgi:hypothetical protein
MNEYSKRPRDVLEAVRSLGRLGLSVSLPDLRSDGQMFFRIDGRELSVAQILELFDKNKLDPMVIREFGAWEQVHAASCGT